MQLYSVRCNAPSARFGWALPAWAERAPRTPSMRDVVAQVALRHRIRPSDILGDSRIKPFAVPRQEAMFIIRQLRRYDGGRRYSLPQIGKFFGRDHTTVMYGVRRHAERLAEARAA